MTEAVIYKNPKPVVVNLIRAVSTTGKVTGLVGLIRNINPGIGGLALPGGYVDEGENIEQAAARECEEETGIITRPEDWSIVNSEITPGNCLLIFCVLTQTIEHNLVPSLKLNPEVQGFAVVDKTSELVFSLHQARVRSFL